jgi:hypothetical protein
MPITKTPDAETVAIHTPGPWIDGGTLGIAYLVLSETKPIAWVLGAAVTTSGEEVPGSAEQAIANTALVIAAPDLLQACCDAFQYIGADLTALIKDSSLMRDGKVVPGTLDPMASEAVDEANIVLAKLAVAIGKGKGKPWAL